MEGKTLMSELQAEIVTVGEKEIHVLSKGRKKVTAEDIAAYKFSLISKNSPPAVPSVTITPSWKLPVGLEKMFAIDLQMGLDFCIAKYNAPKVDILKEAKRVVPSYTLKEMRL